MADGLTGKGRDELLRDLDECQERWRSCWDQLQRAERERDAYLDNLRATQGRCTELLEEVRPLRELQPLANALRVARAKHPGGCDLRSLVEEVGEVASAIRKESPQRVKDELLDVAVVAMRLYAGETCR